MRGLGPLWLLRWISWNTVAVIRTLYSGERNMTPEEFGAYVTERYEDQMRWYDNRSVINKRLYSVFQWAVIILSAIVPVMVATLPEAARWITAGVAIVLAIGTAGLKTFKFQEQWVGYRVIAEALKKERYLYQAMLGDYADSTDKESLFVQRVESLISRENVVWLTTHASEDQRDEAKADSPLPIQKS